MSAIVISGTGLVTGAGAGLSALSAALDSGETLLRCHDNEPWPAARIPDELLTWPQEPAWLDRRKYAGRAAHLGVMAIEQALEQAGIRPGQIDGTGGATVVACRQDKTDRDALTALVVPKDDPRPLARRLHEDLLDFYVLRTLPSTLAQMVALRAGFEGGCATIGAPAFDGLGGLRVAMNSIASGEAEIVALVGVDVGPPPEMVIALDSHERLARSLDAGPASSGRYGSFLGEGAAALIIESEEHAARRGQRALAAILDCRVRASHSLESALAEVRGLAPEQGGSAPVVWSRATGSRLVDKLEAEAIGRGPAAAVTATTGAIGRMLSTSALIDLCLACAYGGRRRVPPVCLTREIDPDLAALPWVTGSSPITAATDLAEVRSLDTFSCQGAGSALIRVGAES